MIDTYTLYIGEKDGFSVESLAEYTQDGLYVLLPGTQSMVKRECEEDIDDVAAALSREFNTVLTVLDKDDKSKTPILLAERGTVFYPKSSNDPVRNALMKLCSDLIKVHIRAVELRMAEGWQWIEYDIGREWAEKALTDAGIPVTQEFIRAQRLAVMRERLRNGVSIDGKPGLEGFYAGDYIRLSVESNLDPIVRFNHGIIIRVVPGGVFNQFHVYDVSKKSVELYMHIPPQDEYHLIALYEQDIENRIAQHEADQATAETASVLDPQHAHIGSHDAYLTEDDTDEWVEDNPRCPECNCWCDVDIAPDGGRIVICPHCRTEV